MEENRGQALLVVILVVLLVVLAFLLYMLYQYIPSEPQGYNARLVEPKFETGNLSYEVTQFYPNMKFNHNNFNILKLTTCVYFAAFRNVYTTIFHVLQG